MQNEKKGEFGKFRIWERMSLLLLLFLSFGDFLPSRILSTKFFFLFESTLFCSVCVCLSANLLIWLDLHQNGLQKNFSFISHLAGLQGTIFYLLHFPPFAAFSAASLAAFMTFSRVSARARSPLTLICPVMKAEAGDISPAINLARNK